MVSGASVVRPPGVERSVPRRWSLQTGLRLDPSAGNGLLEGFVVALVLVGVGLGELGNGLVEGGPGPEVRGDGDAVAGSGVAPGQRLGTRTGVPDQARRNNGSSLSRPTRSRIHARVPTLPTPTTLRAISRSSNCSIRWRRSVCRVRR